MIFWLCIGAFGLTAFGIGIIVGLTMFADKLDAMIKGGKDDEAKIVE